MQYLLLKSYSLFQTEEQNFKIQQPVTYNKYKNKYVYMV